MAASCKLPDAPVTVIVYVPAAVVEATAMVMVEVPEPGAAMEVGLKVTVTPAGWPVADKANSRVKAVQDGGSDRRCAIATLYHGDRSGRGGNGEVGGADAPASALIRPVPFGLPQPVAKS